MRSSASHATTRAPLRTIEYQRPWLYPKQYKAIFDARDSHGNLARYRLCEASTKSGKTFTAMCWILEQALTGRVGWNYWWVAPIYATAKIVYRRLKRAIPAAMYRANDGDQTITLVNGAVIWFKGADKPDSLYGDDVHAVVVDEASRCKDEAWHAVRSTLTATEGLFVGIGNVKGRGNWFYKLCRRAEGGQLGMAYSKIVAADAVAAGILKAREIDDARRALPENVFLELYEAQPSDDGGNPFGLKYIKECIIPGLAPRTRAPLNWGVDLAKKHDFAVAIGLNENGDTAAFERWQSPWRATMTRIRRLVVDEPCLVDSTGVGDPIVEQLQAGQLNYEGYNFTQASKQKLMEGLAVAIQSGEIGYPDGPIVNELESFEYEYTKTGVRYSAPEGMFDDCVCSLALARQRATMPTTTGLIEFYRQQVAKQKQQQGKR